MYRRSKLQIFAYTSFVTLGFLFNISLNVRAEWEMSGGNPQRTSQSNEIVVPVNSMKADWYMPFDSYIKSNFQVITGDNKVYVTTANGLYAVDANSGAISWVYPTDMPFGNSPTFHNNVLFIGSTDHKLHALNSANGQEIWSFESSDGIMTNPLVVDKKVFFANRGGKIYALNELTGALIWQFQTGGAVNFSLAYKSTGFESDYIFAVSNDGFAYALDSHSGKQIWKSSKLPGAGFDTWWPVVKDNYLIIGGADAHKTSAQPGLGTQLNKVEMEQIFPNYVQQMNGMPNNTNQIIGLTGNYLPGNELAMDVTQKGIYSGNSSDKNLKIDETISDHYENQFEWRTVIVLDLNTGMEVTYDYDQDGKPEGAPITWFGTHSGNRYPAVVGYGGYLYIDMNYYVKTGTEIPRGGTIGWNPDPNAANGKYLRLLGSNAASDEPDAHATAGNYMYNARICDRTVGIKNLATPFAGGNYLSLINYDARTKFPGYDEVMYNDGGDYSPYISFGGYSNGVASKNGVYGCHGATNPPIPYNNSLYVIRGNSLFKFTAGNPTTDKLPHAVLAQPTISTISTVTPSEVNVRLNNEVEKIINSGHLRPGYLTSGIMDLRSYNTCSDRTLDYFDTTGENIVPLIRALPYLTPQLRTKAENYIRNEVENYPFVNHHNGWSGENRELNSLPSDIEKQIDQMGSPDQANWTYWNMNPYEIYAAYLYVRDVPGADSVEIFGQVQGELPAIPSDMNVLYKRPHAYNAFIAGYYGYIELAELAGQPLPTNDPIRTKYTNLVTNRKSHFTKDTQYINLGVDQKYCRTFNTSNNFMYMTPELAKELELSSVAKPKVIEAIDEYEYLTPYWFVSKLDVSFGESSTQPLYDRNMFIAKAYIEKEPFNKLVNSLDVPAFERGDMIYIDNLVTALEVNNNAGLKK